MDFTYNEEGRTFRHFGLWSEGTTTITGLSQPEQIRGLYVTPGSGRWFSEADDKAGSADTAIITYGYWQRRFNGDASVIDRTIIADSKPHRIIGVMPRDFRFLDSDPEIILPHKFDRNKIFLGNFSYQGIARLKPGVSLEQASADVARVLAIWMYAWPTPPGMDRKIFENARLGPKLQPHTIVAAIAP